MLEILQIDPGMIGPEHVAQLRLQAKAREEFLQNVPLLDGEEVGELLGVKAQNRSAVASRLQREEKLLAITYRGADLYPAAQIVDGKPSPAIAAILKAFSGDSPWTIALWLNAPSGWLDGQRPLELLEKEPERVVRAARETTDIARF